MKKSFIWMLALPLLLSACRNSRTDEKIYPLDGRWEFVRAEVPPEYLAPYMTWHIRENKIYIGPAPAPEGCLEQEGEDWYMVIYNYDGARLQVRFPRMDRMEVPDINGNVSFYVRLSRGDAPGYSRDGVWQMTGFTFSGRMSAHEFHKPADLVLFKHGQPGGETLIYEIDGEYFTRDRITGKNIPVTLELSENTLLLKYRISNPDLPYDGYVMVYKKYSN
jgi:hypothetical protein